MKCPYCNENVNEIYNMQGWMELDMEKGKLDERDYIALDEYAQEHYDETYCKVCYEELKFDLFSGGRLRRNW